jgi:hypothetical protein
MGNPSCQGMAETSSMEFWKIQDIFCDTLWMLSVSVLGGPELIGAIVQVGKILRQ